MKRSVNKDRMRLMVQEARERIVKAFSDLKEKEKALRQKAREQAQLRDQQRRNGASPAMG